MIEELHLKNCQSHNDTKIEFHQGLNVFTGDTDSGKSAIIRGLDKVINNSVPSKELVSHWGGPLIISLKVDNNKITFKHDKKDSYKLNEVEFNAIGGKVPEEISSLLNMTDINIQNQIDSFFLLNETSGYVASYLNEIANLSQIDSTTKSIKSELNKTKRTIEHDKENLKEKEKSLESYSFLSELEKEIKEAEELESKVSDIEFQIEVITSQIDGIYTLDAAILKNNRLLQLKPLIETALDIKEKIKKTLNKREKLKTYIKNLISLDSEIEKLAKITNLKDTINKTIKDFDKERILSAKLATLNSLLSKLSSIDEKIEIASLKSIEVKEKYNSEMRKLNKCFICGSKLKK